MGVWGFVSVNSETGTEEAGTGDGEERGGKIVFQIREFSLGVMEWLMEMEKKGEGDKEGIMRERTLKFFPYKG